MILLQKLFVKKVIGEDSTTEITNSSDQLIEACTFKGKKESAGDTMNCFS